MSKLILSFCFVLSVLLVSSFAQAQNPLPANPTPAPYRLINSIDVVTLIGDPSPTVMIYMDVHAAGSPVIEQWAITVEQPSDLNPSHLTFEIDGALQFRMSALFDGPAPEIMMESENNLTIVDSTNYLTDAVYLSICSGLTNETDFLKRVIAELQATGNAQGVSPNISTALAASAGSSVGVTPSTNCEAWGRRKANKHAGKKPTDCEGAWDAFLCCRWECTYDFARRDCGCLKKSGVDQTICYAEMGLAGGLDATKCALNTINPF